MLERGLVLEAAGRRADAVAAYDDFAAEFREDADSESRKAAQTARRQLLALRLGAALYAVDRGESGQRR